MSICVHLRFIFLFRITAHGRMGILLEQDEASHAGRSSLHPSGAKQEEKCRRTGGQHCARLGDGRVVEINQPPEVSGFEAGIAWVMGKRINPSTR